MKYCHEIYSNLHIVVLFSCEPRTQNHTLAVRVMGAPKRTAGMESCAGTKHAQGKASTSVMMQLAYRVSSLLAPSCAAAGLAAALLTSFLAAFDFLV